MTTLPPALAQAIRVPVLLIAADFDGTLAPIVAEPDAAAPLSGATDALVALSKVPHTHSAVISGRGLKDLRGRLALGSARVRLIGSHGAEDAHSYRPPLSPAAKELLARTTVEFEKFAPGVPGTVVERKPLGAALHYRLSDAAGAAASLAFASRLAGNEPGLRLRTGSKVIELMVVDADKGSALKRLAHRIGATAVIFFGDDATDEDAFSVLGPLDVGVKVGESASMASLRVDSPAQVVELLGAIAAQREAHITASAGIDIQRHALLSDQRTVALIAPDARITWLCLPRIDSSAIFAEIVDSGGNAGGYFAIEDEGGSPALSHSYDGDSFVLRTMWPTFTVTDYMDCSAGRAWQRAGRCDLVRVIEGSGRVRVTFSPRLDFGRVGTSLVIHPNGLGVEGQSDPIVLYSPGVEWTVRNDNGHETAQAVLALDGEDRVLELRSGTWSLRPAVVPEGERRAQTRHFWAGWAGALRLPPLRADLVRRSALVIKALSHAGRLVVAAAATTSLPEHLGGSRNWDYRYCWPRDAAMAAAALVRLGNTGHALKLLDWLLNVVDRSESPDRLRPIYTVTGNKLGTEGEVGNLAGHRGSRPVRIGNAAAHQVQLDVFAPIVHLVAMLAETGAPISPDHWRLVRAMVQAVEARWQELDHGIWEMRGPKRAHVHSRVMCWHAVNRALVVEELFTGRRTAGWERLRDEIASDVLSHGWNAEAGAFTIAYGDPQLDAAALAIGLTGLLPPGDPRLIATIERVREQLLHGGGVYRYRLDDGLPGQEGTFLLCTSWLIEAMVLIGRVGEARALFDGYAALAGPTGLLAEEYDPDLKLALGNFPQAYSHLGLINCAVALAAAGERD